MLLGVVSVGLYSYLTISELKLKLSETLISDSQIVQADSFLESGTEIREDDFNDYLLYSELKTSTKFLKVNQNKIRRNDSRLEIIEKIDLPKLSTNSCEKFKCLQFRKKFSEIPSPIWKALLGTEDFRFLEHKGIDFLSIGRAIVVDVIAMKFVQGGSTLTQQLVKNLFLTNERKLSRKFKEMIYALYIENVLSKDEIINLYLNEVFWGTFQGVYLKGYYAASIAYFDKKPMELSEYEATILVSLLKGPNYYRPTKKGIKRIKGRTQAVYKRLRGLNLASSSDVRSWSDNQWEEWSEQFTKRNKLYSFNSLYYLSQNSEMHLEGFEKLVFFNAVTRRRKALTKRTENADIGIKVIIANSKCVDFECAELFSFYSKEQRDRRVAMSEEYHQVGSLLKPIVYDTFIELGRHYDEEISTLPITLNLKSGAWTPKDYSKAKDEYVTIKVALQKSKNIPLIKIASEVGFEKLEDKLELTIPNLKKPLAEYPAQLLGSLELSMEQVMRTYSNFIEKKCQNIRNNTEKFEKSILNYMSISGETTISRLAKAPLKNALVFGKTGTSNNGLDNWYYAFDGENSYILWFGVESKRNESSLRVTGASSSYLILQDYLNNRGKQVSEVHCH